MVRSKRYVQNEAFTFLPETNETNLGLCQNSMFFSGAIYVENSFGVNVPDFCLAPQRDIAHPIFEIIRDGRGWNWISSSRRLVGGGCSCYNLSLRNDSNARKNFLSRSDFGELLNSL